MYCIGDCILGSIWCGCRTWFHTASLAACAQYEDNNFGPLSEVRALLEFLSFEVAAHASVAFHVSNGLFGDRGV